LEIIFPGLEILPEFRGEIFAALILFSVIVPSFISVLKSLLRSQGFYSLSSALTIIPHCSSNGQAPSAIKVVKGDLESPQANTRIATLAL